MGLEILGFHQFMSLFGRLVFSSFIVYMGILKFFSGFCALLQSLRLGPAISIIHHGERFLGSVAEDDGVLSTGLGFWMEDGSYS